MTATTTKPPSLDTLRRRLRQAEESADDLGQRLQWRLFAGEGESREDLEREYRSAVETAEALRGRVALALDAEGLDCRECGGAAYVPTAALDADPCPECAAVTLSLPPTRSEKKGRPLKFLPAVRQLTIGAGKKAVTYRLAEFTPDRDWGGRAWTLTKLDGTDAYRVLVSRHGTACDCAGACYEAVANGNNRAYWAGGDVYGTDCCKHASAVRILLNAGLLDAPAPAGCQEPDTDPFA